MSNSSGSPGGSTCEIYPESDYFSPHNSYQAWTPVQATPISGLFHGHSFFLSALLYSVLDIIARCFYILGHHITTLLTNSSKSPYVITIGKAKLTILSEVYNALHNLAPH